MLAALKQIIAYGFRGVIWYKGNIFPTFRRYPGYLSGSWVQWTVLNDRYGSRAIECLYFNNERPSGTAVFSHFINNSYPDSWASIIFAQYDKDKDCHIAFGDRFYTSPLKRRKRVNSSLSILGYSMFRFYYNVLVRQGGAHTQAGFDLQIKMTKLISFIKRIDVSKPEELDNIMGGVQPQILLKAEHAPYKDPIMPAAWHSFSVWEQDDKKN